MVPGMSAGTAAPDRGVLPDRSPSTYTGADRSASPVDTTSNCDLVIRAYEQKGRAVELDIFASQAGLTPFNVVLSQGRQTWQWDSIHHQSHRRFRIEGVAAVGTATIRISSMGKPGCFATAPLHLTDSNSALCGLSVRGYQQTGSTLRLELNAAAPAPQTLDVVMKQGAKEWTWQKNLTNGTLTLPNLPTKGHVALAIQPRGQPGCQVQESVTLRPHSRNDKIKTVGLTNQTGRILMMNGTGWGFDWQDSTGIAEPWRRRMAAFNSLSHNGETFQAIDAFRMLVRWYEYEPREGQYRDQALLAALRWCKANNLKFAVCFWPLRLQNDGLLPDTDWTRGMLGTPFSFEGNQYQPALYSRAGREKLARTLRHMAQVLAPYADDLVYVSMAYGDTEEYFSPGIVRYDPWGWTEITGYSAANRAAWREYCRTRGLGEVEPPVPDPNQMPGSTGQLWANTALGQHWYQFMTLGLREFWTNFQDAIREGSGNRIKVAGFYADVAGAQSAWYLTYNLKYIFEGSDIIYSTDGGNVPELFKKLMATDFNRGTFPQAQAAIEFDPHDLSHNNSDAPGTPLNPATLRDYGGSFFRRGGSILHFAMTFSDGDAGRNQIEDLAPALYYLRTRMIEQAPRPLPTRTITIPLVRPEGDQLTEIWQQAGGSLGQQVRIIQDDSAFWR